SHTWDGVDRLSRTVATRGVVAMVGSQWRFHPCVAAARGLVADDDPLGPLVGAEIEYQEYLPDWHPYEDYRQSYAARAELGGGVVLTQIHDYDIACHLFGIPVAAKAAGGHLSSLETDVEDTVDARLFTTNGRFATLPAEVRVRQTFAA